MLTGLISSNVLFDRSKPQSFIRVFINEFHRRGEEANLTRFRTIAAKSSRLMKPTKSDSSSAQKSPLLPAGTLHDERGGVSDVARPGGRGNLIGQAIRT